MFIKPYPTPILRIQIRIKRLYTQDCSKVAVHANLIFVFQTGSRVSSPVEVVRKGASRVSSPVEEGSEARKDSGLESCEMSDCSEDGGIFYVRSYRYP
jgi:hypothetical protein